jgi:hypothetical protein
MSKRIEFITVLSMCFFVTGCLSSKSYVDPQYRKAMYSDINHVETKYKANIDVEFQRNGKHFSSVDNELRGHVERVFRATGVVVPATEAVDLKIKVVANNIADISAARNKGFVTGLTFGVAGTCVTDFYEIIIEYQNGGPKERLTYKHAIHTTIGNSPAPIPVEPTPGNAFAKVVEDVILNFVKEMQQRGKLTYMLKHRSIPHNNDFKQTSKQHFVSVLPPLKKY